ncbi:hypothetical protein HMPREF3222_01044 [Clostridium perfringens]|uniref:Uncharacterized protein n=2 Tax=Clostridium perfringens TaxID=1502 RepID=A0A133N9A2_CLOPF|nr:hypothetical protein HMPREF3222_01044 [Clostridium perfringens]
MMGDNPISKEYFHIKEYHYCKIEKGYLGEVMKKSDLVKELNKFSKRSLIETLIYIFSRRSLSYEALLLIAERNEVDILEKRRNIKYKKLEKLKKSCCNDDMDIEDKSDLIQNIFKLEKEIKDITKNIKKVIVRKYKTY